MTIKFGFVMTAEEKTYMRQSGWRLMALEVANL
jgi:hypothetical protein